MKGRSEAQITANDLALYLVSTDVGKLGIIRRNKYPSKHVIAPYQDGKRAITRYLSSGVRDLVILTDAIDRFQQLSEDHATSPFKRDDARRSKAALEAFLRATNQLELGKYNFQEAPKLSPLVVADVKISTSLDLLTTAAIKGKQHQGGVILRLTIPEDTDGAKAKREAMGGFSATLALMQIEDKRPIPDAEPMAKLCLSIDVQAQQKYEAKAGSSQRRSNIVAACTMIKSIWPSV